MRWLAVLLFGTTACYERVEVELHPEEGDKSVVVVINGADGATLAGANLSDDASNQLSQVFDEVPPVGVLYFDMTLEELGLSPGYIANQPEDQIGIPLPPARHFDVVLGDWAASWTVTELQETLLSIRVSHSSCAAATVVEAEGASTAFMLLADGETITGSDRYEFASFEEVSELPTLTGLDSPLNFNAQQLWFRRMAATGEELVAVDRQRLTIDEVSPSPCITRAMARVEDTTVCRNRRRTVVVRDGSAAAPDLECHATVPLPAGGFVCLLGSSDFNARPIEVFEWSGSRLEVASLARDFESPLIDAQQLPDGRVQLFLQNGMVLVSGASSRDFEVFDHIEAQGQLRSAASFGTGVHYIDQDGSISTHIFGRGTCRRVDTDVFAPIGAVDLAPFGDGLTLRVGERMYRLSR